MKEIWKDIISTEGRYSVSNLGRIKNNDTNKIRSTKLAGEGYISFSAYLYSGEEKRFNIHRLVARYFVKGYFPGAEVNHKDGNKKNNIPSNLKWVTHSQNLKHCFEVLGHRGKKLTEEKVLKILKLRKQGHKRKDIAKKFGLHPEYVGKITRKLAWAWVE